MKRLEDTKGAGKGRKRRRGKGKDVKVRRKGGSRRVRIKKTRMKKEGRRLKKEDK